MNSLFAVIVSSVLMIEIIDCQFGPQFGNPFAGMPFPHFGGGGRGHHRGQHRNEFSRENILAKVDRMEEFVDGFLDRAIAQAQTNNSSNVRVLQELRNTDVPQFFNSIKQKLSAGLSGGSNNTTTTGTIGAVPVNNTGNNQIAVNPIAV